MASRYKLLFILIVMLGFCVSCSTLDDVIRAKTQGKGKSRIYPITMDQAWDLSLRVLRWEGTDAIEQHRDEGYMLTSTGVNLISNGAVMGVWLEKIDSGQTRVTFITKRRISLDIFTTTTHKRFFDLFSRAVGYLNSGKPVPEYNPMP